MTTHNFFYDGLAISKQQFEANVPEDWREQCDEYGNFSWGLYRAIPRD